MKYLFRNCLLAVLLAAATANAQTPIINTFSVNDNRICELTGSYAFTGAGFTWEIAIEKVRGRYVALVKTSEASLPSDQNASIRLKQVPPTSDDGLDSIRLEGSARSREDGLEIALRLILKKNNLHRVRINQRHFGGSVTHNNDFIPSISDRGIHVDSPQVNGNKITYSAYAGSALLSTDAATCTGLKMGECTLKVRGPGFKVVVPGTVTQAANLEFDASTEKPASIKVEKINYHSMQPFEFVSQVIDAN